MFFLDPKKKIWKINPWAGIDEYLQSHILIFSRKKFYFSNFNSAK